LKPDVAVRLRVVLVVATRACVPVACALASGGELRNLSGPLSPVLPLRNELVIGVVFVQLDSGAGKLPTTLPLDEYTLAQWAIKREAHPDPSALAVPVGAVAATSALKASGAQRKPTLSARSMHITHVG
jgi:hypothetical protein